MQVTTTSPSQSLPTTLHFAEASFGLARNVRGLLSILGIAALLMISAPVLAQSLGAAQSFAILGGAGVQANGIGSIINGDVGVAPAAGSFITGIPASATVAPPFTNHGNDAFAIAARAATTTLYGALVAATPTGGALLSTLNGQSVVPGTYTIGAALLTNNASPFTLNGAGTYIFQVSSSLTADVGSGSNIVLNGVNPCNVFWQVSSAATLNGTTFPGTVVAGTSITLGSGAILTGRALAADAGLVTLAGGNTVGVCSALATPTLTRPVAPPDVVLGTSINDVKTLAGGAGTPGGTITFNLYAPTDLACTGTVIFTSTVPVNNGNGTYTSASYTPSVVGTYRWIANYSGDANNAATANACNAANASMLVTSATGAVTSVPTLSEWAMIMLATLLAIVGFAAMRRRAR